MMKSTVKPKASAASPAQTHNTTRLWILIPTRLQACTGDGALRGTSSKLSGFIANPVMSISSSLAALTRSKQRSGTARVRDIPRLPKKDDEYSAQREVCNTGKLEDHEFLRRQMFDSHWSECGIDVVSITSIDRVRNSL